MIAKVEVPIQKCHPAQDRSKIVKAQIITGLRKSVVCFNHKVNSYLLAVYVTFHSLSLLKTFVEFDYL